MNLGAPGSYVNSGTPNYKVGLTSFKTPSNRTTTVYAASQPNVVVTASAPATSNQPTAPGALLLLVALFLFAGGVRRRTGS